MMFLIDLGKRNCKHCGLLFAPTNGRHRLCGSIREKRGCSWEEHKIHSKKQAMLKKFGITTEQYDLMLKKQKGVCAICKNTCRSKRNLAIDHSKKTGQVRGLLCMQCNLGIGHFGDDVALIKKAAMYLST